MQSLFCLALGGLLLIGAGLKTARSRAVSATLALAAFLILAFVLPLPAHGFTMGDGSSIVQDRSNFDDLVRHQGQIRFSAHLAYRLLDRIDAALGSTPSSSTQAYRTLSWLCHSAGLPFDPNLTHGDARNTIRRMVALRALRSTA